MLLDVHTHVTPPSLACIFNADANTFQPLSEAYYALGVHPWHTSADVQGEWERVVRYAPHPSVLAIGETGLDKLCGGSLTYQAEVFKKHIQLSEVMYKPLVIHCVKAFNELLVLHKQIHPSQSWVIHGYRNNWNIAQQLLDKGLFLSFGEKFNPEVVKGIPMERMLVETDESTLSVMEIVQLLADCKQVSPAALIKQLQENVQTVFFDR